MTVVSVPPVGGVFSHRLWEHQEDAPEYSDVVVIAVTAHGERVAITAVYVGHRDGRRDVFAMFADQFARTYPTMKDGRP